MTVQVLFDNGTFQVECEEGSVPYFTFGQEYPFEERDLHDLMVFLLKRKDLLLAMVERNPLYVRPSPLKC